VTEEAIVTELSRRVEEQLGRYGVAGRIETAGFTLVLIGHGPRVLIDVRVEAERFASATDIERRQMVERIARELSMRRRASVAPARKKTQWLEWGRLVLGAGVICGGLFGAWQWFGKPAQRALAIAESSRGKTGVEPTASAHSSITTIPRQNANANESPSERCKTVRTRVATGGSVSPLDADGWVVELSLLSSSAEPFAELTALKTYFRPVAEGSGYRVAWNEEPTLSQLGGTSTLVQLIKEPLVSVLPQTRSGVRIVFTGQYVPLYFDSASRQSFLRLASALYEGTFSNYGALYAHCAAERTHHLGSWFRGSDWGKVSTSLVASMGLYAEVPHLIGVGFTEDPLEQRRAITKFFDLAKKFDRERVKMLLSDDGGMIAASPGKWATYSFPFTDGNRATRTSARLTKTVGLGASR
jgi:hypothetical protein